MKRKHTLTFSLALAACTGLALAQASPPSEGTPSPESGMSAPHPADLNDDGRVGSDEFRQFHENLFAESDKNGDGALDPDEIRDMPGPMSGRQDRIPLEREFEPRSGQRGKRNRLHRNPEEFFTRLDANEDGRLGRDEAPERMARHFDRLDADSDGSVTREEFKAARPDRKAMRKRFEERLKSMDANEDGLISKQEASGRMSKAFDRIDANDDGAIDSTEIETLRSKFRRHGKRGGKDGSRRQHRADKCCENASSAHEPAENPGETPAM